MRILLAAALLALPVMAEDEPTILCSDTACVVPLETLNAMVEANNDAQERAYRAEKELARLKSLRCVSM